MMLMPRNPDLLSRRGLDFSSPIAMHHADSDIEQGQIQSTSNWQPQKRCRKAWAKSSLARYHDKAFLGAGGMLSSFSFFLTILLFHSLTLAA